MFITRKSLPRRVFLRGMGVTVALPLLDAMVPAFTALAHTAARPPKRLGFVYVPHGVILDKWTPASTEPGFELPPIMAPMAPLRDRMVVVSNLSRQPIDNHAVAASSWLSSQAAKPTEAEDVVLGTTIDQIVAQQIGRETPFPSIEVAIEDFSGYIGGCSPGYSCAYMNTLSWASPTAPLPMEINPRVLFERMFGRASTREQRLVRMRKDRSLLDSISEDANRLQHGLGARDRARLDEYLQNIREIERRIQRTEAQNESLVTAVDAPIGVPESYAEHAALMYDLLAVAYQSDLTRVFSFMMARELSTKAYPEAGVSEPHHSISHHGNAPAAVAAHTKVNTYHVTLFADFMQKLQATPDGDGSLLDHSLIFYGSGMGNGNVHAGDPLPLLALGGGAGRGNRHLTLAAHTPIGNMWMGVANQFECQVESIGASTGRIEL